MLNEDELYTLQIDILCTLMACPERIGEAHAVLAPEDFCEGTECRALFQALTELHAEGAPITAVSLRAKVGSALGDFAARELKRPVSPAGLSWSLELLRSSAQLKALRCEGLHLSMCRDQEQVRASAQRLFSLMSRQERVEVITTAQAVQQFYDRQDAPAPEYLHWGIRELDESLFIRPGDFVVLGGYPSSGKTLLSIQFALEQAKRWPVGYFSLETGPEKLTDRIIAHAAQVELGLIKTRKLRDSHWDRISAALPELVNRKLTLIDAAGMAVSQLRAMTLAHGFRVIVVDYLQLLHSGDSSCSRYEQVTAISMELHTLARQCNCAVLALAQLSRPERSGGRAIPPGLSSFRESGQIEQDADAAMLIYPSNTNDNSSTRVLKLAKNKEGPRCRLELLFDGPHQTLRSVGEVRDSPFQELEGEDEDNPF